jgi:hypothetical protein
MVFLGSPAVPHQEFKRGVAAVNRIPRLLKSMQAIEARLTALENGLLERGEARRGSDLFPERESS